MASWRDDGIAALLDDQVVRTASIRLCRLTPRRPSDLGSFRRLGPCRSAVQVGKEPDWQAQASTQTWSLVPKPPRERPSAWACRWPAPGAPAAWACARMTVASSIAHSDRFGNDRLEHTVQNAHPDPAVVALFGPAHRDRSAPGRSRLAATRARHPQQRVDEQPTIAARSPLALPATGHERLDPLPLIVAQNFAFQDRLQKAALNQHSRFMGILNRPHRLVLQPDAHGEVTTDAIVEEVRRIAQGCGCCRACGAAWYRTCCGY